jgi:hypothetical protein
VAGALVEKPCLSAHASPTPDTRNADLLRLGDLAAFLPIGEKPFGEAGGVIAGRISFDRRIQ